MIKNEYKVIGVMSGTSLDGIDLAYISFTKAEKWEFKIYNYQTIGYSKKWKEKLANLTSFSTEALQEIDKDYTLLLAEVINQFITKNSITDIDVVCSHGHTALHQPENQLTYQIGNLPELTTHIKQNVVCDFRVQDVALGGQGAPLVPIGDQLLFNDFDYCINLGGFANVSMQKNNKRIAFDICPVNIVLNKYVSELGLAYDDKGNLASIGNIDKELLNQLNSLQFYKLPYPKSLGLEWVQQQVFPLIKSFNLSIKDTLRTVVEHVAIQIAKILNKKQQPSVLITGGGVYNTFLISRIEALTNIEVKMPSEAIIEFKEALIFGFLGVLKLRDENNCLASVTGAKKDHSSGEIFTFNT